MTELTTEVRRLLERPNYAHLATLLPDGAPHSVPVWIDVEGPDQVVILTGPGSRKARNVAQDPRVAISIIDVDSSPATRPGTSSIEYQRSTPGSPTRCVPIGSSY